MHDENFKQFYDRLDISDLVVHCGCHQFNCHKFLLCPASAWFRDEIMKDPKAQKLSIENTSPEVLEVVLKATYGMPYNQAISGLPKGWRQHMRVYQAAQYFSLEKAKTGALKTLDQFVDTILDGKEALSFIHDAFHKNLDEQDTVRLIDKVLLRNLGRLSAEIEFVDVLKSNALLLRQYVAMVLKQQTGTSYPNFRTFER